MLMLYAVAAIAVLGVIAALAHWVRSRYYERKLRRGEISPEEIPQEVLDLVEQRAAARKAKDFAEADRLRDAIAALGYSVRETRQGVEIKKV